MLVFFYGVDRPTSRVYSVDGQLYAVNLRWRAEIASWSCYLTDRKLRQIVYDDVDPLRRGRARGNFPTYQQICQLFE
jgi:hypothetical protein